MEPGPQGDIWSYYGPNIHVELNKTPTLYSSHRYNVTNKQEITSFLNTNFAWLADFRLKVYIGKKLITTISLRMPGHGTINNKYTIHVMSLENTKIETFKTHTHTNNNNNNYRMNNNNGNNHLYFAPNTCVSFTLQSAPYKKQRTVNILPTCDFYASNGKIENNRMDSMGLSKAIARAFAEKQNITEIVSKELEYMRNHHKFLNKEIAATGIKRAYRNTWAPNHPMMVKRYPNLQTKFNTSALP
jgi:hypothetical protein